MEYKPATIFNIFHARRAEEISMTSYFGTPALDTLVNRAILARFNNDFFDESASRKPK
ncbi:MAG: hypothetical protein P9L94_10955 [Candidatus Hinthialibacter antarcticus]|nr:hypothetical protein [Candidatus Hinthialibacter antarcticus]